MYVCFFLLQYTERFVVSFIGRNILGERAGAYHNYVYRLTPRRLIGVSYIQAHLVCLHQALHQANEWVFCRVDRAHLLGQPGTRVLGGVPCSRRAVGRASGCHQAVEKR